MVEAQRFPWDFDGIVAVAPDMGSEADLSMRIVWKLQQLADKDGQAIFRLPDLELLHNAALRECDLSDGLKDGIIGDPVGCQFDPSVLACTNGHHSECLSAQQIRAAKNIYAGPTTSKGVRSCHTTNPRVHASGDRPDRHPPRIIAEHRGHWIRV